VVTGRFEFSINNKQCRITGGTEVNAGQQSILKKQKQKTKACNQRGIFNSY